MEKRYLLFKFIFFLFVSHVKCQEYTKYQIRPIPTAGPYKITNVRETTQDNFGFLWIGTQEGLFRYGSKMVDNYTTGISDKHSLITPDIRSVLVDSINNKVWISGTGGGINVANLITGVIEYRKLLYNNERVISISRLCNRENKIFIASSFGVFTVDKKTFESKKIYGLDSINVLNLLFVHDKLILFTQSKGIIYYDLAQSKIVQQLSPEQYSSKKDLTYFEAKTGDGCFYVATSDGIKKFTIKGNSIAYNPEAFNFLPAVYSGTVFGLCIDNEKNLWYSTENDLIKINQEKSTYHIIRNASSNESSAWLNSVYTIFCDKENNIWLGCQQGLAYLKNSAPEVESISDKNNSFKSITQAYYLYPLNDSLVYTCSENGLFKVIPGNESIIAVDKGISYDYYYNDSAIGTIVSNTNGIFQLKNNGLIPFERIYKEFEQLEAIRVNSIVKSGTKYVFGTENYKGIIVWDFKNRTVKNFDGTDQNAFNEPIVNTVVLLANKKVAILGDTYFNIFDIASEKTVTYNIKKDSRSNYSVFFDLCKLKSKYYIASYGNGVVVLDSNFVFEREISSKNGLSNNGVYKLIPWRDSLLFVTTNNGLNCLNVSDNTVRTFYETDGLHDNVFEETSGNFLNDKIYAGGKGGFSVFHPLNLHVKRSPPVLYFYNLVVEIANAPKIDSFDLTSKVFYIPINTVQTTINFIGINYSNPERTTYQYRILEQSRSWINLNTQNFITLIGLSPGTYRLEVKAANEDGIWSEPKQLVLKFLPKWNQTWWFKLLVILAIAGIIYAFYRYRIRQIKKQHEIRKNIATDLHDDLGSTLNSVKVFTNLAISGVKQEESLQQIKDNLNEATIGLRDMIWVLDDSLDTVDELVTRLKQYAIPVAGASNIEAIIKADSEVNSRQLTKEEKRNLFLVCKEAINNGIKYSGATQINVTIVAHGKKIQITIADNGRGFDINEVKKGYGLKNMQYRAGQIKYKVVLNSAAGKGTQINIQPL